MFWWGREGHDSSHKGPSLLVSSPTSYFLSTRVHVVQHIFFSPWIPRAHCSWLLLEKFNYAQMCKCFEIYIVIWKCYIIMTSLSLSLAVSRTRESAGQHLIPWTNIRPKMWTSLLYQSGFSRKTKPIERERVCGGVCVCEKTKYVTGWTSLLLINKSWDLPVIVGWWRNKTQPLPVILHGQRKCDKGYHRNSQKWQISLGRFGRLHKEQDFWAWFYDLNINFPSRKWA